MVNTLSLYPGSSLSATTQAGNIIESTLKDDRRFKFIQTRAGRAAGDTDAAAVKSRPYRY